MIRRSLLSALLVLGSAVPAADALWQNNLDTEAELRQFSRHASDWDLKGGTGGSACLKFHNDEPKGYPPAVNLDPALFKGKTVVLSAMIKAENLKEPANKYWGPKVCFFYQTADGKSNFVECPKFYGTYDWKEVSRKVKFPENLVKLQLLIGLQRCAGTFMVDSLSIREESAGKNYEKYTVSGWTDREKPHYKPGEPMHFYFRLLDDKKPVAGKVRVVIGADDGRNQTYDTAVSAAEPLHIATSLSIPGFVMVRVQLLGDDGKVVSRRNAGGSMRPIQWGLAAGVEPERLVQGVPEPADFDAFWTRQKQELAAVPLRVLEKKPVRSNGACNVYDVKLSCAGPRPVSGYLSIPKNAKPGSLPAELRFDGYSVQGAKIVESPRAIVFFVNPHGIENGREAAYYDALRKGELSGYGFRNSENLKPETVYFRFMILRGVRAAEFLKSLPEWDGKNLKVIGGSQGAFQATAVCGLIDGATECHLAIPWFCDLGGIAKGRVRGWRPDLQPGLGYYDTVNFASRVKCPVRIDAGLSDWVCPPSGVWILYNNLKVPSKSMTMRQGFDHAVYHGFDRNAVPRYTVKE